MARKMNRRIDKKHFRRDAMKGSSNFKGTLLRGGKRI